MPTNLNEAYRSPFDPRIPSSNMYHPQMPRESPRQPNYQPQIFRKNAGLESETITNYSLKGGNANPIAISNSKQEESIEGFTIDSDQMPKDLAIYAGSGLVVLLLLDFIFTMGKYSK